MSCTECKENVFIPFKIKLKQGESKFYLDVPDHILDKNFSFTDLDLIPSFYSLQASQLNLNEDPEFAAPLADPLSFKIKYRKKFTDLPEFVGDKEEVVDFMKDFNEFVELNKPAYVPRCSAFVDWTFVDPENKPFKGSINKLIREQSMALMGVDDPLPFSNALPDSVSDAGLGNDYVLPHGFEDNENIRIRLWIAPYSRLVIRSQEIVDTLGFTGVIEVKNRQFTINNGGTTWRSMLGKQTPKKTFAKTGWKIDVGPLDVAASPNHYLLISQSMLSKPSLVADEINAGLQALEQKTNVSLKLYYTREDGRYQIKFPDTKNMDVTVVLPKAAASVLGFVDNSVTRNTRSLASATDDDNFDTLKRCRALAIDTSAVVVTQNNLSAFNLIGSTNYYVATLKPSSAGTMHLLKLDACTPVLNFNALNPSQIPAHRIVQFQLCAFDDFRNLKPLNWPCSSFLQGMLVGRSCSCAPRAL